MYTYKRVLTIAGSDSGGGAGIQADLKTIAACRCYGTSVITALTAQNTTGVQGVFPVAGDFISNQIDAILSDIGTDAVKIGMLHNTEAIKAVKTSLEKYEPENVILDPVMVSTSGDKLLMDEAIDALKKDLFPLVTMITPNIPEAEILIGKKITSQAHLEPAAVKLGEMYGVSVLLKAGHLDEDVLTDVFYNQMAESVTELPFKRIETNNTHGTGCTLSSAVAAYLARGYSMYEAVHSAREYLEKAMEKGKSYTLGKGHGPVHHFFEWPNY